MIPALVFVVLLVLACLTFARVLSERTQAAYAEGHAEGKDEALREHGLQANRDARWQG